MDSLLWVSGNDEKHVVCSMENCLSHDQEAKEDEDEAGTPTAPSKGMLLVI